MLIINTKNYQKTSEEIAKNNNYELAFVERKFFPDGEQYLRVTKATKDEDVVIISGTTSAEESLELFDLTYSVAMSQPKSLKVFILYFGYSTMERQVKDGEVVRGLSRSYLFDSLPPMVQFYTLDIHSPKINNEFKSHTIKNLSSVKEIINLVDAMSIKDLVIASPDEGRSNFILELAHGLNCPSAYVSKKRTSGECVEVKQVFGDVKDKNVVIYDDMIRSGSTLLKAAQAYKEHGAKNIYVISTHGVFDQTVLMKMKDSNLFKSILISDSHPKVQALESDSFLKKFSILSIIEDEIKEVL
jgi:ribose-phosphate pyrophosphokinase